MTASDMRSLGTRLKQMISDDSEINPNVKRQCAYIDCITLLNQSNAKDQLFCSVHQIKVTEILDKGEIHPEYLYYKQLLMRYRKFMKKKGKISTIYQEGALNDSKRICQKSNVVGEKENAGINSSDQGNSEDNQ